MTTLPQKIYTKKASLFEKKAKAPEPEQGLIYITHYILNIRDKNKNDKKQARAKAKGKKHPGSGVPLLFASEKPVPAVSFLVFIF